MKESQKMSIALIGLGSIAQKAYLPILTSHPKVKPILCTRNTQHLKLLANQYRIHETYSDIDELLNKPPDAAMVHSSTESHFTLVSKLLNAGIPVFVDKPLSYSLQESEELLNLAMQKNLLLYVGFNRRFAPLIHSLTHQQNPIQIFWQKNRVGLPGTIREFIFDDFIHVIDSLRFLASGPVKNIQVFPMQTNQKLESLHVAWQQNDTLLNGTMNRISGITEEHVAYYSKNHKWEINELTSGFHYHNEVKNTLGFDHWKSTLYKRGFVDLIDDWLAALQSNTSNTNRIKDIWETHNLCETIITKISKKQ